MSLTVRGSITRERQLLTLLFELNEQIGRGTLLDDLLQQVVDAAQRLARADFCWLLLSGETGRELICRASAGLSLQDANKFNLMVGRHIVDWVAEHGEPLWIPDTAADRQLVRLPQQAAGLRSLCCVPLRARDGVIGVINAGCAEAGRLDGEDQQFLHYVAAAVAKEVDNARLYRLAVTDHLTGAFNRQFLCDRLPAEVERHRRYDQSLSVAIIDVDQFERVNDTWGHPTADRVLRELTRRLMTLVREVDALVRYGGDEFLVILPSTDLRGARNLAERLRAAIATRPVRLPDAEIQLTVSGGVAELVAADQDATALLARADAMLYQAKAAGRNRILAARSPF